MQPCTHLLRGEQGTAATCRKARHKPPSTKRRPLQLQVTYNWDADLCLPAGYCCWLHARKKSSSAEFGADLTHASTTSISSSSCKAASSVAQAQSAVLGLKLGAVGTGWLSLGYTVQQLHAAADCHRQHDCSKQPKKAYQTLRL